MTYESFYTSAPRGLKPSSSGFCTVAATEGMPATLIERLEMLSGYQPPFPPGSPDADKNPPVLAHWRLSTGAKTRSVLSRVAFTGVDHTHRSNKLAYHLMPDAAAAPAAGPAWVLMQPYAMMQTWFGPPRTLPPVKRLPDWSAADTAPSACMRWESITGDAGWAGVLAEAFLLDPWHPVYLIRNVEIDPLPLLDEAIRLLPPRLRWQVTFNTYFTELPAVSPCSWRCVLGEAGIPAKRGPGQMVLDLTRPLGRAPEGPAAEAARAGRFVPAPSRSTPSACNEPPPQPVVIPPKDL